MTPRNLLLTLILMASISVTMPASAQNPFLPLWEYIPDGEPYVFEDPDQPGKYRVYIYGSHDSSVKEYCGLEQVTWSAPVDDLTNWRYDGIIFQSKVDANGKLLHEDGRGDMLYAPDVAVRTEPDGSKTYYLYPNNQEGGRQTMIAKSKRPDGPFEVCNWSKTNPRETDGVLKFDPAAFVDDDGRVYGYWGFEGSYGAELDPATMATVKPGTKIVEDMIPHRKQDGVFRFFEASSIRKIKDKYVFIYSRWTADGDFGLPESNYTLAYAYSDNPLGPFTYGGTIIDGRARAVDAKGKSYPTASPSGNTHGSIFEANGQWWVVYHRQTGLDEFSRQAMVAPITVSVEEGKGGKVTISEGEYTSEGFAIGGLNPLVRTAAGTACYYMGPRPAVHGWPKFEHSGSYIQPTRWQEGSCQAPYNLKLPFCPVVNNTDGSTIGYKYFNFDTVDPSSELDLVLRIKPQGVKGVVTILLGGPTAKAGGKVIGSMQLTGETSDEMIEVKTSVSQWQKMKGKQPLYFAFSSETKDASMCELYDFMFVVRK